MDVFKAINNIKNILSEAGYENLASKLINPGIGSVTEYFMLACSRLLNMKDNNPSAYEKVEDEVRGLLAYAHSIGLFPKASEE